jgi:hypothetical protein
MVRGQRKAAGEKLLRGVWHCRRGQGLAEYGLILAVLSLGAAASSIVLEKHLSALWRTPTIVLASMTGSNDAKNTEVAAVEAPSHALMSTTLRPSEPMPLILAGDRGASEEEVPLVLWQPAPPAEGFGSDF